MSALAEREPNSFHGVMGGMEQDMLFRQADEARETARRLIEEAREQALKSRLELRRHMSRHMKRLDQPLLWFGGEEE